MKLVASMPVKDEFERYLVPVVENLLTFVDEVRALDDGSTDGGFEWLKSKKGVVVERNAGPSWEDHEARFRRTLQAFTLAGAPSHVLAIDADELVVDGIELRHCLESRRRSTAFTLRMVELWGLKPPRVRIDGGWRPHEVGMLYRVPKTMSNDWQIHGRALACPRAPRIVDSLVRRGRSHPTGVDVLHLGWSDPAERERRFERYARLDGGSFHAREHLESILDPDERCELRPYPGAVPLLA